jgi:hypothetical protein
MCIKNFIDFIEEESFSKESSFYRKAASCHMILSNDTGIISDEHDALLFRAIYLIAKEMACHDYDNMVELAKIAKEIVSLEGEY